MATLHDTAKATDDTSGTSLSTLDALAVTAGDLIVLLAKCEGATTTVAGSDSQGNTYLAARAFYEHSNADLSGAILYAVASATGTINPTATYGASRPFRIISAYSFTLGAGKSGWAVDASAVAEGSASTASSAGTVSATASGVAVAAFHLYGSRVLTAGAGWSIPAEFSSSAAQNSEYQLVAGAGSITGNGTQSGVVDWIAQLAVFKETSGASTPVTGAVKKNNGPGINPSSVKFAKAPRAIVPNTATNTTVTGASSTLSQGTLVAAIGETLTGSSISVTLGSSLAAVTQTLTGSSITVSTGALSPGGQAGITGSSVTTTTGTLSSSVVQSISGQSITSTAGDLSVARVLYGALKTAGPGLVGPFNNGQFISSPRGISVTSPNVTVTISGASVSLATGALVEAITQSLTGNLVTFAQGTVTTGSNVSVSVSGIQITSAIGSTVSAISEIISGQAITVSQGSLTEAIAVSLSGSLMSFGLGTVSPSGGTTAATITIKAGSWLRYKAI